MALHIELAGGQRRLAAQASIIVRSVKPNTSGDSNQRTPEDDRVTAYGLRRDDYRRILSNLPTIRRAVPLRDIRFELRNKDRRADAKLVGCSADYPELNQLTMARGRWFGRQDDRENVIVLADDTARRLFPYEDPIGKTVQLPTISAVDVYTVIGQTRSRDPSAAIGGSLEARDYNLDAYIPLSTFRSRVGDFVMWRVPGGIQGEIVELSQITVSVNSVEEVDETAAAIETLLKPGLVTTRTFPYTGQLIPVTADVNKGGAVEVSIAAPAGK